MKRAAIAAADARSLSMGPGMSRAKRAYPISQPCRRGPNGAAVEP